MTAAQAAVCLCRVKDNSRSHTVLVEKYEALQEKFEALQEEQWLMCDRVEELLTLHEENSSQVDQVSSFCFAMY